MELKINLVAKRERRAVTPRGRSKFYKLQEVGKRRRPHSGVQKAWQHLKAINQNFLSPLKVQHSQQEENCTLSESGLPHKDSQAKLN